MAATDTIAVAIRFRDGRIVCQERSAAPTPHWFRDARLLAKDEAFIESYVGLAKLAQNDVTIPVRPAGHGLVVIDLRDDAYLTMQGFFDYRSMEVTAFGKYRNPQYLAIMTALVEAGRLRIRTRAPGLPERIGPQATLDDVFEAGGRVHAGQGEATEDLVIDTAPLAHTAYATDAAGMAAMRAELARLGFEVGEGWDAWLEGRTVAKPVKKPAKPKARKPAKPKRAPSRRAPRPAAEPLADS